MQGLISCSNVLNSLKMPQNFIMTRLIIFILRRHHDSNLGEACGKSMTRLSVRTCLQAMPKATDPLLFFAPSAHPFAGLRPEGHADV